MSISLRESYIGKFGDKRLDKRANKLSAMLYFGGKSSIHGSTLKESEQKSIYRFLRNDRVSVDKLIQASTEKSKLLCADRDLLVIQDTTEINLDRHRGRLKPGSGIGLMGNNANLGFFFHCSLVLDANSLMMLGFSDMQFWCRSMEKLNKYQRDYKHLPIDQKESYKWIKASECSRENLSKARSITIIEDREGDIFEQFATIPDDRTNLIIRSRDNRRLKGGQRLFGHLANQPVRGSYKVDIVQDIRKHLKSRTAHVEVRFCKASIAKPDNVRSEGLPGQVAVHAIEVREVGGPECGSILWRILTTHTITSNEQAVAIINKYRQRWHIEQMFRLLKNKGFQIESSELETGWAIRKLTVMIANTALRVMQLRMAYKSEESQPIEEIFSADEIKCLHAANKRLQGDSKILTNNNPPGQLSWATWVVARLGGWKPYDRHRSPGPIIIKRGLERLQMMLEGYYMAQEKDVS